MERAPGRPPSHVILHIDVLDVDGEAEHPDQQELAGLDVPQALAVALADDVTATPAWNRLSPSQRKEHAWAITEATGEAGAF